MSTTKTKVASKKNAPPKVPPIKIQGIKTKLVRWIVANVDFPENGRWVEPFMGSAVVGINFAAERALFCDTNPHTINFYNGIKDGTITSNIVRDFLEKEGAKLLIDGVDYYLEVRRRFNEFGSPLDFLFLNRSCFNGIIRFNKKLKFNVPFGKKPNRFAKAYVTKIVNQVAFLEKLICKKDWEFRCQDFTVTLKELQPNDFLYCDPPYIGRHVDYYDSWSEENEIILHDMLVGSGNKFLLSTWDNNEHRTNLYLQSIWGDCNKVNANHFYHVGGKESNRKPIVEALVFNYEEKIIQVDEFIEDLGSDSKDDPSLERVENVENTLVVEKRKRGRPKKHAPENQLNFNI